METAAVIPEYRVRILAERQQLEVTLTIPSAPAAEIVLDVATWVPGAYAFLRYARDVLDVTADGDASRVVREGLASFRVHGCTKGAPVVLRSIVQATDPAWSQLTGFVRHDQAVLLATCYLALRDHRGPVRVAYETPAGWALHHPSGARAIGERTWEYASFAALLDTPVVGGRFDRRTRDVEGTPFHFVFLDETYGYAKAVDGFVDRVVKQALELKKVLGPFPFDDYTFIYSFDPRATWGLERANASMCGLGELALVDDEAGFTAVRVSGHELMHAWNVCRMKPAAFAHATIDLVGGSFARELWIAEGWTRYYEFVLAVRAGEIPPSRFFSNIVCYWRNLDAMPGYRRNTVVDSSYATFLNHHHWPGMSNASIDYYGHGMLVAFDLDAALRLGGGSLDAELRAMWDAFGARAGGYTHDDACALLTKRHADVGALVRRETETAGSLSVPATLEALGFALEWMDVPRLGLVVDKRRPSIVTNVLEDGAAAAVGLASDDEIVRVGDVAFQEKGLVWAAANEPAVTIEVKRGHAFHRFTVEPRPKRWLSKMTWNGDDAALARIASWLSAPDLRLGRGESIPLTFYDNFHGTSVVI